eukprot:scaffold6592_cov30-Tisochrysis_lutea.AAC.1
MSQIYDLAVVAWSWLWRHLVEQFAQPCRHLELALDLFRTRKSGLPLRLNLLLLPARKSPKEGGKSGSTGW